MLLCLCVLVIVTCYIMRAGRSVEDLHGRTFTVRYGNNEKSMDLHVATVESD